MKSIYLLALIGTGSKCDHARILLPEYNETYFYFLTSKVTSDALVDVLSLFWKEQCERFSAVKRLVLNQDNGPECNSHRTQFMNRIVEFCDENSLFIRLAYYPPYHSKYNPIERCFAVLENEWNGDLLDTIDAALGHASSMTWNGIHPVVTLLEKVYETGKKLTKEALKSLEKRLQRWPGLEKWFVDIKPKVEGLS